MIFNTVLNHETPELISAAFYAVTSLEVRLSMVSEVINIAIQDASLKDQWKPLRKRTKKGYVSRNKFAHWTTTAVTSGDETTLKLTSTVLKISSRAAPEHDFKEITEFRNSFHRLADDLFDFQKAIGIH